MGEGVEARIQFERADEELVYDIGYAAGQMEAWHIQGIRKRSQLRKLLEWKGEEEEDG